MIGRTNSGGGAGIYTFDAMLRVAAPANSVVSATRNGFTMQASGHEYADDSDYSNYYFIIPPSQFGTWTVNAVNDGATKTESVDVLAAKEYDVVFNLRLPATYQEVQYVTFPSGAYINTNVSLPNQSYTIFTELKLNDPSYVSQKQYIRNDGGFSDSFYQFKVASDVKYGWARGGGSRSGGTWTSGIHTIKYGDYHDGQPAVSIDGTQLDTGDVGGAGGSNLLIGYNTFVGDIYYIFASKSNTDEYVRKMYPCYRKEDDVVGFYDTVNDVFYTNAGTGTLVAGPKNTNFK